MADVRILYFAWVRERIGREEESISLSAPVSLQELAQRLRAHGGGHDLALADLSRLRAAINQDFAPWTAQVEPGDEVAIFPPVTGG